MASDAKATAQLGRRLVTMELQERGFAVRKVENGRRVFLAAERDGRRHLVRVTAKRTGTWQTSITYGARTAGPELRGRVWVFVDIGKHPPTFFVVPEAWMAEDIHRTHEEYLRRNGGTRAHTPSSTHHSVPVGRIEQWHERWDVLDASRS